MEWRRLLSTPPSRMRTLLSSVFKFELDATSARVRTKSHRRVSDRIRTPRNAMAATAVADTHHPPQQQQQNNQQATPAEPMDVDASSAGGSVSSRSAQSKKRVTFVGSQYIEYDIADAPVVRRCGIVGQSTTRSDADIVLEWQARVATGETASSERDHDHQQQPPDDVKATLIAMYNQEMRTAIEERGLPVLDESLMAVDVQFRLSTLLVAWSLVAPHVSEQVHDHHSRLVNDSTDVAAVVQSVVGSRDASLADQCSRLELCRKLVLGPPVEGYVFGRRFFSIEAFLLTLEFEELVELAVSHGIDVPQMPQAELDRITVADRELIATYSPTGMGKPLKMLTFRELVEEAYARGIIMDDVRDINQKKSKRAWVDALRPVLRNEMVVFKIREAHTELLHDHLAKTLEVKMQTNRLSTIINLVRGYLGNLDTTNTPAVAENVETAHMHRYFRFLLEWHDNQPPSTSSSGAAKPAESPEV